MMVPPEHQSRLKRAIIGVLQQAKRPLSAQEIKSLLISAFPNITKGEINPVLYGDPTAFKRDPSGGMWALTEKPGTVIAPAQPPSQHDRRPSAHSRPSDDSDSSKESWRTFKPVEQAAEVDEGDAEAATRALLYESSRPAAWIGSQLRGIWRLVYEVGGPRSRAWQGGVVSLPPEVANAWAAWSGRDGDESAGRWETTKVDTLPEDRGYTAGDQWRRWTPRQTASGREPPNAQPDLRPEEQRRYEVFCRYLEKYPFLQPQDSEHDAHFAERVFLREVAIPLLGDNVLRIMEAQAPFDDPDGSRRYCDFLLRGKRTYAVEVEGFTVHAPQFVTPDQFAQERRRVQAFAQRGWHHMPVSYLDLTTGAARRTFREVLSTDERLGRIITGIGTAFDSDTASETDRLVQAFHALQSLLLAAYSLANGTGEPLQLEQSGLGFPLLELAVRDLDLVGELGCCLHGERWDRPPVGIRVTVQDTGPYLRALAAFHGVPSGSEATDRRLDRPTRMLPPLVIELVDEESGPGGSAPSFGLGWISPETRLSMDALQRLPPLPSTAHASKPRRPSPEDATPRRLDAMARRLFRVPYLRPEQLDLLQRAFRGESFLGVLPTGFGKSLCFQLPAYLSTGTTIVVSPLRSLMRDQVHGLARRGLGAAELIASHLSSAEKAVVLHRLQMGQMKILYLSPERLEIRSFAVPLLANIERAPLSYLAVDEAHCVSEWGHDFRPSYLRINEMVTRLSDSAQQVPTLALTATASSAIRQDICRVLRIQLANVVQSRSIDRPELSLSVHPITDSTKEAVLAELVNETIPRILALPDNAFRDVEARKGSLLVFGIYAAPTGKTTLPEGIAHIRLSLVEAGAHPGAVRLHSSTTVPRCKHCGSYSILRSWGGRSKEPNLRCAECNRPFESAWSDAEWDDLINRTQDGFLDDEFPTLVATKGFGMGIDKPNIRAAIHFAMPGGLEASYQEGGRAGRDGHHSHLALLFRPPSASCVLQYFRRFDDLGNQPIPQDGEEADYLAPPCLQSESNVKFRRCPESLETWCDYARQAQFIASSFQRPSAQADLAADLYREILFQESGRHVDVPATQDAGQRSMHELALYRLRVLGLFNDDWVTYPHGVETKRHEVRLSESWSPSEAMARFRSYVRTFGTIPEAVQASLVALEADLAGLGDPPADEPVLPPPSWVRRAARIQAEYAYRHIRLMRYRMLHNLWRYCQETAERRQCRRWFLTTLLDAAQYARPENHKCMFCDVCCPEISALSDRDKAEIPQQEWQHEDLTRQILEAVECGSLETIDTILESATGNRLSLRNVALHHLEAAPDSIGGLYLASRSTQLASHHVEPPDPGLVDEAVAHASQGFRSAEGSGADIVRLEPFARVLQAENPARCLDLMDRKHGPYDGPGGLRRMLQLEPLLLEDPDKHDQLDRAISSGAAVFVGSAISEFTDTLAAALQEAQRLMGEGVNGGTNL